MKREDAKRGARATELELEADREQFIIPRGNGGSQADYARGKMEAERLRTQADALTLPVSEDGHMVRGGGEAVAVEPGSLNSNSGGSALAYIYDTLEHPASLSLEESEQRMRAALDLGVLQSALDAAQSADARTSMEKMLCHQMAAAHQLALRLLARGDDPDIPPVDVARLMNTAARLMSRNLRFTFTGPGLDVEGFGGMACSSFLAGAHSNGPAWF